MIQQEAINYIFYICCDKNAWIQINNLHYIVSDTYVLAKPHYIREIQGSYDNRGLDE